jgi:hypothetical protein
MASLLKSRLRNALCVLVLAPLLLGIFVSCGQNGSGTSSFNKNPPTISLTNATMVNKPPTVTITVAYEVTEQSANFFTNLPGNGVNLVCTVTPNSGAAFKGSVLMTDPSDKSLVIKGHLVITDTTGNVTGPFVVQCMFDDSSVGAQPSNSLQACAASFREGKGGPLVVSVNGVIPGDCTAPPTDTPVQQPASDSYYIFVIAVEPGGSIVVGTQADVQKPSCDFTDGGTCSGNDPNVQVLATLGGPYPTQDQAVAAYCQMLTETHPAFGGTKGTVNGMLYWLDNAPACPGH